jgi:hypothetical protein
MALDHRDDDAAVKILEFRIIHAERLLHFGQKPLSTILRQYREVPTRRMSRASRASRDLSLWLDEPGGLARCL